MKFQKSFLFLFGLVLIIVGLGSTLIMFITGIWFTYIFPILLATGLVIYLIDIPIRKSKRLSKSGKLRIQIIIIIVPLILVIIKTLLINPRAEIIIVNKNFDGPYIIVYGVKGQPALPRDGRNIIVKIPSDRILLTSTKEEQTSDIFETYIADSIHKYGIQTNYLTTYNGTLYNLKKQENSFYYRAGFFHNNVDTFYYDTLDKWASNILDSLFNK